MNTITISISLGQSKTNLILQAQIIDINNLPVDGAITDNFYEIGNGNYMWTCNKFPDLFYGGVYFCDTKNPDTVLSFISLDPSDFRINPNVSVDLGPVIQDGLFGNIINLIPQTENSISIGVTNQQNINSIFTGIDLGPIIQDGLFGSIINLIPQTEDSTSTGVTNQQSINGIFTGIDLGPVIQDGLFGNIINLIPQTENSISIGVTNQQNINSIFTGIEK